MSFFAELKRRNVFKVAAAYIIVGWLVMQVGDTLGPALLLPGWINSALAFFLILGFPLAMFFAWAFEVTPEGIKKEKDVDRGSSITRVTSQKLNGMIIGLLVLALGYFAFDKFVLDPGRDAAEIDAAVQTAQEAASIGQTPTANDNSIAVLPFVNMSDDAANEYFSDGISEEILNALAKVKDIKVAGRTSSFSFKGKDQDLRQIGEALGVQHILEGSVRKAGNQVRITAQLIQTSDGFHLWSETFDRELTDIFAIQDEIAQTILKQMKLELIGGQDQLKLSAKTDVQTYELYLRARQLMYKRNLESLQLADQLLRQAVAGDPGYAPAHVQLGVVALLASDLNYGTAPAQQARETALPMLQKAVDLDPDRAEGWAGLGFYYLQLPGSLDLAIEHLRKSLTLNPNQVETSNWLQNALLSQGRIAESTEILEQILERDPLYQPAIFNLAIQYVLFDQLDRSQALMERSKRYLADDTIVIRAEIWHYLLSQQTIKAYPIAKKLLQAMPSDPSARRGFSVAQMQLHENEHLADSGFGWPQCVGLSRLKRVEEAETVCRELISPQPEEGTSYYFEFLVNNGREQELLQHLAERWPDLDAFENNFPGRDGYAWRSMGYIAQAYRFVGNEEMFTDALQRFRASLDFQRSNGADNPMMELSEGYYFALAEDWDSALTHLEGAGTLGLNLGLDTSSEWTIFKKLDGTPRFEALKQEGHRKINEAREQLGLEPLSS